MLNNMAASFLISPVKISLVFFTLFIFTPRINFFQLSGGVSDLRLDVLSMFLFWAALIPYLCFKKFKVTNPWVLFFIFLWFQVALILPITSSHPFNALGQILWYSSMIACVWLGYDAGRIKTSSALKIVVYFSALNSLMHLSGLFLYHFLGIYTKHLWFGFFHVPSPFAFVVAIGFIMMIHTWEDSAISKRIFITLFVINMSALLLSDSRVGAGAFFIALIISKINNVRWFFAVGVAALASLLVKSKALSIFLMDFETLSADPSLGVRFSNFVRYLEWVDLEKFFFGGGALSFLEYSIQYGRPGHLDSFYAKILSDHGFIFTGLVLLGFVAAMLQSLSRNYRLAGGLALVVFIAVFSLVNEALSSVKSGHFAFFALGLCFFVAHHKVIKKTT
ncbi:hypothetical protein [Neptuniibacter caesariensis]|nr:hypothetical protein [Neptuniibacter caesariensis]